MKKKIVRSILFSILLLFTMLLTRMRKVEAEGTTTVYVNPPMNYATLGQTFLINVEIANVTNLYGYEFILFYNTTFLDGLEVRLPPGHFLTPVIKGNIFVLKLEINDVYNTTHGRVYVVVSLLRPEPPKNGSGTLVTIAFKVTGLGRCTLDLYNTKLANSEAKPIPCVAVDGYFECVPFEHDVAAFLDVPGHLIPGDSVLLNATVMNGGLNNETYVELRLVIDDSIVDSVVISFLQVGSSYTLSYLWMTPIVEAICNVTAYALPVPNEDYTTNNVKSAMVLVSYVIRVPYHYQTIQEAIDAASPEATIIVSSGTYRESLTIDKPLTLVGEEGSTPIIDGGGKGVVVYVTADNVDVSKFTIQNGPVGIVVEECNYVVISDNTITKNTYGIELGGCSNIVIEDNRITNNSYTGIALSQAFENKISGNKVSENRLGICLHVGRNNFITRNRVSDNEIASTWRTPIAT